MKPTCLQCKGRGWCGKTCNWSKINFKKISYKREFSGTSPTIFIGKSNYPKVNIGIMSPQFNTVNAKSWDDPIIWSKEYQINQVIKKRTTLVNSTSEINESFLHKVQEIALSKKPVNIEVNLRKTPKARVNYDFVSNPMGPSSEVKKVVITENISMHKIVEKCYYDFDLKSIPAINKLYNKGFNENEITKMFSTGAFGVKKIEK